MLIMTLLLDRDLPGIVVTTRLRYLLKIAVMIVIVRLLIC